MTRRALAAAAVGLALAACATTIDESAGSSESSTPVSIDETIPTTTALVAGSTTERLLEMVSAMSQLGSVVAEGGDDEVILERIVATWAITKPEVRETRAELVGGIDTTVEMAQRAVDSTRPADADKAFRLLSDLVDDYTGDG